jgi:hypothetical protein
MLEIQERSFVESHLLKKYEDIDGLKVIEEYLLFKGTDDVRETGKVASKKLEETALVFYGLKSNPTNKLFVGFYLEKWYRINGLRTANGSVKIPQDIFYKVDELNKSFRK